MTGGGWLILRCCADDLACAAFPRRRNVDDDYRYYRYYGSSGNRYDGTNNGARSHAGQERRHSSRVMWTRLMRL